MAAMGVGADVSERDRLLTYMDWVIVAALTHGGCPGCRLVYAFDRPEHDPACRLVADRAEVARCAASVWTR